MSEERESLQFLLMAVDISLSFWTKVKLEKELRGAIKENPSPELSRIEIL